MHRDGLKWALQPMLLLAWLALRTPRLPDAQVAIRHKEFACACPSFLEAYSQFLTSLTGVLGRGKRLPKLPGDQWKIKTDSRCGAAGEAKRGRPLSGSPVLWPDQLWRQGGSGGAALPAPRAHGLFRHAPFCIAVPPPPRSKPLGHPICSHRRQKPDSQRGTPWHHLWYPW